MGDNSGDKNVNIFANSNFKYLDKEIQEKIIKSRENRRKEKEKLSEKIYDLNSYMQYSKELISLFLEVFNKKYKILEKEYPIISRWYNREYDKMSKVLYNINEIFEMEVLVSAKFCVIHSIEDLEDIFKKDYDEDIIFYFIEFKSRTNYIS